MIRLTADAAITNVLEHRKLSLTASVGSSQPNLLHRDIFKAVSPVYQISADPRDYLYVVAWAVTADIPNDNGDNFTTDELTRFNLVRAMPSWQTFLYDPHHINHNADDPTQARGFIVDAHFRRGGDPQYVETLVAVDRSKDPYYAKAVASRQINKFSMGCDAEILRCRVCGNDAYSIEEFCNCLRQHKGQRLNGRLVYNDCINVIFAELSGVGVPADKRANTQHVFQLAASVSDSRQKLPLIASLGLSSEDQAMVAKYLKMNLTQLPSYMRRLAAKLFV